jgi:hypothetical protein
MPTRQAVLGVRVTESFMQVEFRRTGQRRYAITILRKDYPMLEMNPAPGYDPIMPHDLLHLIVEKELGLHRGIFGQIAAGGTAGTFHAIPSSPGNKREAARLRRRVDRRGKSLLREGRAESALSERVVYVCLNEWLARSTERNRRTMTVQISSKENYLAVDGDILTGDVLDRVCASLDQVSEQWASLKIGESFAVTWPERLVQKRSRRKLKNAI